MHADAGDVATVDNFDFIGRIRPGVDQKKLRDLTAVSVYKASREGDLQHPSNVIQSQQQQQQQQSVQKSPVTSSNEDSSRSSFLTQEDKLCSISYICSRPLPLEDILLKMPGGVNFAAKARAAELNAARARRATRWLEEKENEKSKNGAPVLPPLTLGDLKFIEKRARGRHARENSGTQSGATTNRRLSDDEIITRHDNTQDHHSGSNALPPPSTHFSTRIPTTTSSVSDLHDAVAGQEPGLNLQDSSSSQLHQGVETSSATSQQTSPLTDDIQLARKASQSVTLSLPSISEEDTEGDDMTGGSSKRSSAQRRSRQHTGHQGLSYAAALQFDQTPSRSSAVFPSQQQNHMSLTLYQPRQDEPFRRQDTQSHSYYPGNQISQHQPYGFQQNDGYGAQMPFNGQQPSAMDKFADSDAMYQWPYQPTAPSRPHEDPFTDMPSNAGSHHGQSQSRFQPPVSSYNHAKFPHQAVKGTRPDEERFHRVHHMPQDPQAARDYAESTRQAYEALYPAQMNKDSDWAASRYGFSAQTAWESPSEWNNDPSTVPKMIEDPAMIQGIEDTRRSIFNQNTAATQSKFQLQPQAPPFPFKDESGAQVASPEYDREFLKYSDPLPRPTREDRFPSVNLPTNPFDTPGFGRGRPSRPKNPYTEYSNALDKEICDLLEIQQIAEQDPEKQAQRQNGDINVLSGDVPIEHEAVRLILLRNSGLDPDPKKANVDASVTDQTTKGLRLGSQPLGTPTRHRSKHAAIGSERHSLSGGAIRVPADVSNDARTRAEKDDRTRAAIDVFAPVLSNLQSYAAGTSRGYFDRFAQPPAWCIDNSPGGNKSLFSSGDWGNPPQRVARDPRYVNQSIMHDGRMTYFEDPDTGRKGGSRGYGGYGHGHGPSGHGSNEAGPSGPSGPSGHGSGGHRPTPGWGR